LQTLVWPVPLAWLYNLVCIMTFACASYFSYFDFDFDFVL
jgi:hypothetical protein